MKLKKLLLPSLMLFSCITSSVYAAIPTHERNALIALYNSTNGDNWKDNEGWLGEVGTECTWHGIMCDDNKTSITVLNLNDNELTGSIPAGLGQLSFLTFLRLSNNQLTGSIPAELGQLSLLTYLALYSNKLTGSIPAELGQLSLLTSLYLDKNQLTGKIPAELGQLSFLTSLHLSTNPLTGSIPAELGQLSLLTSLRLDNNQLTGSIPAELGQLSSLTVLYLYQNELTGSIPVELSEVENLTLDPANEYSASPNVPLTEENNGYVKGKIHDACNGQPLPFVNVKFSDRLFQQGDKEGYYSYQLPNDDYVMQVAYSGYESESRNINIDSSTRFATFALAPPGGCDAVGRASSYKAVIVAAGGAFVGDKRNNIWSASQELADKAYQALKLQGFGDEHIYYLSADVTSRDADEDGQNDIDGVATLANLKYALTEWAGDVEDVVLYMVGHGDTNTLLIERNKNLSAVELDGWLDTLQSQMSGKLSVVVDACYSGSFIASLAAKDRYVLASTTADLRAVISNVGGSRSFSYYFWDEVVFSGRLGDAFRKARQAMSSQPVGNGKTQKAVLDTNADRTETKADYQAISRYCYGLCNAKASLPPEIISIGLPDPLAGELSTTLRLTADTSNSIEKGWVTIKRPDYNFPTDESAISSFPQIELNCQSNTCEGVYNNFNLNGEYLLTFYVEDDKGEVSLPQSIKIQQTSRDEQEWTAPAVFEFETGLLTLKDVAVEGQHYYVELKEQTPGHYDFSLQYVQPLTNSTQSSHAVFDGQRVKVPSVFALGNYYALDLLPADNDVFALDFNSIIESRER